MRILILSDIHANLVALETVLSTAAGQYDAIWCLGDVVGYGPRPNECAQIIAEKAELCVMGNHDWAALGRPGMDVNDFNPQARQAVLWTRRKLTEENRAFLDSLSDQPVQSERAPDILVTHASPREPVWEYILTPSIALENFAVFSEPICLVGHTHKPAVYRWRLHSEADEDDEELYSVATVDYLQPYVGVPVELTTSAQERLILNPGSVGQPRDNDARAAYAILDLDQHTWTYERVAYPIELTQSQMRAERLPKRLVDRLSFGW
ncbi:MAG: metallophosphoesterase family protein [Caldilineaceae bacterium]|nr:metallophosphoesterase family protein [Caldilineaceae bacterium]